MAPIDRVAMLAHEQRVTGLYRLPGKQDVWIPVRALAVRVGFGRMDVLVEPIDGRGQKWVKRAAVVLDGCIEAPEEE